MADAAADEQLALASCLFLQRLFNWMNRSMLFLFQEQAHELTLRLALPVPWMVMMAISAMSGSKFKTWHMPCEGRTHCFYFCFKAF